MDYIHSLDIAKLNWPAKSPDLNPIENVWGLMQTRLNKLFDQSGEPSTENALFTLVEKVWNKISAETINSLYKSMPKRIQLVKNSNGQPTKY